MPEIPILSDDRKSVDMLTNLIRDQLRRFPVEARMVFALEVVKLLKPEIDELKRRSKE